jgi:hypothetical protein
VNDRDFGELIGTVRGMAERLGVLESATREGFRQTQDRIEKQSESFHRRLDERAVVWEKRFGALERWRYWIMGGLAVLSLTYAAGLVWLANR